MTTFEFLLQFVILVFFASFNHIQRIYRYWYNLGVPYIEPNFPNGNISSVGKTEHFFEVIKRFYFELKDNGKIIGGVYFLTKPVAIALDMDFVRTILVKDFHYFHDRGFYVNERDDPLMANLLTIEGPGWKSLRSKLSPSFTSRRIKSLIPIIMNVSERFVMCLKKDMREDMELSGYMSRFMIDIIAISAFGLDCDSLKDPSAKFLAMGNEASNILVARTPKSLFMTSFKKLSVFLRLKLIREEMFNYYKKIVTDTLSHRQQNNIQRDDFLNMLTQLRNKDNQDDELTAEMEKLKDNEVLANAFLFIVAGYHTSAATMEFCLMELAHNIEIQDNLRKEITTILEDHNNVMTYEAVGAMKYLDKVVNETLRKHPPGGTLVRSLRENYTVPNMDLVLEKGTQVFISVLGIHRDPDIYPNPEKFDPERFSPEAIKMRHPQAFLAFGEGPRNCIGLRFAIIQIKIGIATLLMNYKFLPCEKTIFPIQYKKIAGILRPMGGCWLKMEKVEV